MINLTSILNLDLEKIDIFELTEEHLILLETENFHTQSNFYFWLYNKKDFYLNCDKIRESSYCYYLLSYFTLIIMAPMCHEEVAYNHIRKALKLNKSVKYMEWSLIFATLEKPLLSYNESKSIAEEVLLHIPDSLIAQSIALI